MNQPVANSSGNVNSKRQPGAFPFTSRMCPPWFSTIVRQIKRPIPKPFALLVSNGVKMHSTRSSGMPGPLSAGARERWRCRPKLRSRSVAWPSRPQPSRVTFAETHRNVRSPRDPALARNRLQCRRLLYFPSYSALADRALFQAGEKSIRMVIGRHVVYFGNVEPDEWTNILFRNLPCGHEVMLCGSDDRPLALMRVRYHRGN